MIKRYDINLEAVQHDNIDPSEIFTTAEDGDYIAYEEYAKLLAELTCRSYEEADFVAAINQYADLNDELLADNDKYIAENKRLKATLNQFRGLLEAAST